MDLKKIPAGKDVPSDLYAVIEIPQGSAIKYELDKESGAVFVDRFLHTAMFYPGNYGFIPQTLSQDGDPCDIMVFAPAPVQAGSVLRCRPVGALMMEDESGVDEKILAVPVDKVNPVYSNVKNYTDLPQILLDQVVHFFEHYKDLEKGKWVKLKGWVDVEEAKKIVNEALANASKG